MTDAKEITLYDAAIIDDKEAMEAAANQNTGDMFADMMNAAKCGDYRVSFSQVTREVANKMEALANAAYKRNVEAYEFDAMCKKCGGKGVIDCYKHVHGGQCFRCGGDGVSPTATLRRPERPSYAAIHAVAAKRVNAEVL